MSPQPPSAASLTAQSSTPPPLSSAAIPQASAGYFAHHGWWAPGIRLFRSLQFAAKAVILSAVLVVPVIVLLAWQVYDQAEQAMADRRHATRQHAEIVHGLLEWAHAQERGGQMSREQAQAAARQAISRLRYDQQEYFWINDMHPRMVMHPFKPELDGQDLSGYKDPNGLPLFQEMVATVKRQGRGFVNYQWPRPGDDLPVDKVSYVTGFEPWGWVVGTGVYVDDIRAAWVRRASWTGGIVVVSLLVAGYLFMSFYFVMDGGLRETRRHLQAMTEGDLTTSPSPWGRDEAAELMVSLRAMQDALRRIVREVRHGSEEIVHTSSEIAAGALDLSARTEQTAANLQETAASMEEISGTVKSSAEHADTAARIAGENSRSATQAGEVMQRVVATMDEIGKSSSRIGEIIGTIDGIAFQTNILALNAAVEAARAGEAGRGFAVVAAEVRNLAQRSSAAAREIKTLINDSAEKTQGGVLVVQEAGQAIGTVVDNAHRIGQLIGEIAQAAKEEALGVQQVGDAAQELDRSTQQNAALVEQTAAAASALSESAQALAARVETFRLPAADMTQAVSSSSQPFDFDQAIEAHRAWKVKLRTAIARQDQLDAQTICRDDACPLGRWLHGPGRARWGSRPTFVHLVEEHAGFHRAAGEVARAINARRYDEARRMIDSGSRFTEQSNATVRAIMAVRQDL